MSVSGDDIRRVRSGVNGKDWISGAGRGTDREEGVFKWIDGGQYTVYGATD